MQAPTISLPADDLTRAERYLASDPGNPHLLSTVIDLCLSRGELDRARQHADAAMRARPEDSHLAARRGNVLIAQGQLDEAAAVFQALQARHADPALAFNLGLVLFRQGKYTEARAVIEPLVATSDDAQGAMIALLVRILHHSGELDEAVALIERHAPRLAREADFLAAASLVYLDADRLDEAHRCSAAALSFGVRPLEALVAGGSVALAHDDAIAALSLFSDAVTASPRDGRSWSGLGMASLLNGDLDGARDQLKRALDHMPSHIGTWHALGWCQVVRGEVADAQRSFQQALALDRNFGETHGGLAVVSALQGKKAEAAESIERADRLDPEGLSAQYAKMILSGATSDPEKFKRLAMRVLSSQRGVMGANLAAAIAKRSR